MPNIRKIFQSTSTSKNSSTTAMIIDLGCDMMKPDDADAYLGELGASITRLRAEGIPICWVFLGDHNEIHKPLSGLDLPRDRNSLASIGYFGPKPDHQSEQRETFNGFINHFGPRKNETLYSKFFKSALLEPSDYLGKPQLQQAIEEHHNVPLPDPAQHKGETSTDYLRGFDNLLLMGQVSTHCVTETALSAAVKGFKPIILSNLVVGWSGDETSPNYDYCRSGMAWRENGLTERGNIKRHEQQINMEINKIAGDPRRGFMLDELHAIQAIRLQTLTDYLKPSPPSSLPTFGAHFTQG